MSTSNAFIFPQLVLQWKMEFKSKAYILMIFTLLSARVAVATVQTLFNQLHSTNYICSAYLLDGRKKKKTGWMLFTFHHSVRQFCQLHFIFHCLWCEANALCFMQYSKFNQTWALLPRKLMTDFCLVFEVLLSLVLSNFAMFIIF